MKRLFSLSWRVVLGASLTVVAGWLDVLAFRHIGAYSSFMSGNTTRFSLALEGRDWAMVAELGSLLLVFLVGAAGGTLLAALAGRWRVPAILIADSLLIVVVWDLVGDSLDLHGTLILAAAMGLQNAILQQVGPVQLGKTYVTGAVAVTGQRLADCLLGRGSWSAALMETLPWLALVVGAVLGVGIDERYGGISLLGPAALLLVLALVSLVPAAREEIVAARHAGLASV